MNRHRIFSASLISCANYNKIHSQRPPHVAGSACAPQAYSLDDEPLPCRSPFHNRDPPRAARSPPRSPRALDEAAVVTMKRRKPQSRSLASATHASLPSSHRCNVAERARPGSARAALSRALWCPPLRTEVLNAEGMTAGITDRASLTVCTTATSVCSSSASAQTCTQCQFESLHDD